MARRTPRPHPTTTQTLSPILRHGPRCGNTMWAASHNYRTLTTLTDVFRLTRKIRRCIPPVCPQFQQPYRPEAEGRVALPKPECGLDVIALVGSLRSAHHRRLPERQQELGSRRMMSAPRTVQHLLERSDALVALSLADPLRLQQITHAQGRVILALEGLPPDVGHEVLWVRRDCLSAAVLLARSLLSATQDDLAALIASVRQALGVPIVGVISDGQPSLRGAVEKALPDVPPQLCHFHSLRAAAKAVDEADRHAKQARKKRLRGVRPSDRQLEKRPDPEAEGIRGYGSAGRSALTDEGHPPLAASGLQRPDRLTALSQRLERVAKRGAPEAARPAAHTPPAGLARDGSLVARGARCLPLGPSGGSSPHQRRPTAWGHGATSPGRPAGRDDAHPSGCRGPYACAGHLPQGDPELLARPLSWL